MYPVFFSVSSQDIAFAEAVWEYFSADKIYLYSKSGEEGVELWEEIAERALPESRLYVAFWSKHFVTAPGAVAELHQAAQLARQGVLKPLVLRLDDYPIKYDPALGVPRDIFDSLDSILDVRTSRTSINVQDARHLVDKVSETLLSQDHPQLIRGDVENVISDISKKDRFLSFPALWLSGYNGVGRQTLAANFHRRFSPNARPIVVDVNETSLPNQIKLRLDDEGLGATIDELRDEVENAEDIDGLLKTIGRIHDSGNYVVLRQRRIVEEGLELPEWMDDVINGLTASTRPKVYVISQMPLSATRRARCEGNLADYRISTVAEDELKEFAYKLIGHFDKHPERWDEQSIDAVIRAAAGTVGMLVTIIRSASRIQDFDQIGEMVGREADKMGESISVYARWAFNQIEELDSEKKVLVFLNDVSPCDPIDLEAAIKPNRPMTRILGKLLDLGLVERDVAGLYRLTPLLSRRLSRDLIRSDLLVWQRATLRSFASTGLEIDDGEHEYVRIEARLQAAMWAGETELPEGIRDFQSAAHWFQAGVRLYHARHRDAAYRVLKKAFEKRSAFRDASRFELIRYFGLSAVRNHKDAEADLCITLLKYDHRTSDLAIYLEAFKLETQRHYIQAAKKYEDALTAAAGKSDRQQRILRALVYCILNTPHPDYVKAEKYAKQSVRLKETVFSLMALARVYLEWYYRPRGSSVPRSVREQYDLILDKLRDERIGGSAYHEVRAQELEYLNRYPEAIAELDFALRVDSRFELRTDRWMMMARSRDKAIAVQVIDELEAASRDPRYVGTWGAHLRRLTEIYAKALSVLGRLNANRLAQFAPSLEGHVIASTVSRARTDP
ncbi:toll/interleukin-1 receptor domain-containing protein [Aurantiacibacter luteus]|uniref:toll/interleukin-1 receptor domain-containing protein n=1 Tax=Aurantiacibacter luteus TaxID=1581420 RepID=UPI000A9170A9|nr:toll/interleukin-1 receptor domain-containing protein [Aurantiacibacter luteus]